MLYFQSERHYRTGNVKKYLFLGHCQHHIDKNSEDLVILILEVDDVTENHLFIFEQG